MIALSAGHWQTRKQATSAAPLRAWAFAIAMAAGVHWAVLWWATSPARSIVPAAAPAASLMVQIITAPPTVPATPPLPANARRDAPVAVPGSTRSVSNRAMQRPASAVITANQPDAAPTGSGAEGSASERAAPSGQPASGTGRLDLNLNTQTFSATPSLNERTQRQLDAGAPRFGDAGAGTRITEGRGSGGQYRARVQTSLGSYCLRGKDPGSRRMSDLPMDNTLLPSSCD